MKEIRKGDMIYSIVNASIKAVAYAQTDCYDAPRPIGLTEAWHIDGYRVDVDYFFLTNPVPINPYRSELAALMPPYNAPIAKSGVSNTGYMFNINEAVYDYLFEKIVVDYSNSQIGQIHQFESNAIDDDSEYSEMINEIIIDDTPATPYIAVPEPRKELADMPNGKKHFPRESKVTINALKRANHQCEYNNSHPTFRRKRDGKPYMEPHHLIPLSKNYDFDNNLDVQANIISLCSHCHNQIHYGSEFEIILKELYDHRKAELNQAGIGLNYEKLLTYYK